MLGIEGNNREREFLMDRSRQCGRWDDGNEGFDNSRWEVLDQDIRKWDVINDFLKLKVDICILGFNSGGILELQA